MSPDNARNAAYCFNTAVTQLREYASLLEHGIERPINLELAFNNVRFGLLELQAFVTISKRPEELHRLMKRGREEAEGHFALGR